MFHRKTTSLWSSWLPLGSRYLIFFRQRRFDLLFDKGTRIDPASTWYLNIISKPLLQLTTPELALKSTSNVAHSEAGEGDHCNFDTRDLTQSRRLHKVSW